MIPDFKKIPGALWHVLPPGIHIASFDEVHDRYAINSCRARLFERLERGSHNLFSAGCPQIFLDGSYVTEKPYPNDYEVCWDMAFVNPSLLDPVFFDFSANRFNQKQKYFGEYFPTALMEGISGKPFLDFFQTEKDTGKAKGIIKIVNYLTKGGSR